RSRSPARLSRTVLLAPSRDSIGASGQRAGEIQARGGGPCGGSACCCGGRASVACATVPPGDRIDAPALGEAIMKASIAAIVLLLLVSSLGVQGLRGTGDVLSSAGPFGRVLRPHCRRLFPRLRRQRSRPVLVA